MKRPFKVSRAVACIGLPLLVAAVAMPGVALADPISATVVGWIAAPLVGALGEGAAIALSGFILDAALFAGVSVSTLKMFGRARSE